MQRRGCKLFHNKLKHIPPVVKCKTKSQTISIRNNINNITSNIHKLNSVGLYNNNNINPIPKYVVVPHIYNYNHIMTVCLLFPSFPSILYTLYDTINII